MTNKTKQKVSRPKNGKQKKPTPFADAGTIVGSKVSTMFNAPWAKGVGRWLGSGIGQIFGSGDYQMVGARPDYNVLTNGNQIPSFSSGKQTNIVCHREYLRDISGTTLFQLLDFPLNPGVPKTFPWLSTIAQNYQQFKFHGLIFEFRPLITDFVTGGAPGVVVMATNYNADAAIYTSKHEMENSEYAVSVKPTREMIHGVECAANQTVLSELYVRGATNPSNLDKRFTDLGTFQIGTQGNPAQLLGEIWVSYCVEFFKPILPKDTGGNVYSSLNKRITYSPANPLGLIQTFTGGDLATSFTGNTVSLSDIQAGNRYEITICWTGAAAVIAFPVVTVTNGSKDSVWSASAFSEFFSPSVGATSTSLSYNVVLIANDTTSSVTLTFSGAGVYPTGGDVTIVATQISTELSN